MMERSTHVKTIRVVLPRWIWLALLAVAFSLLSACGADEETVPITATPRPTVQTEPIHIRTFEAIWSAVNDNYVYIDFLSEDWQALHDEYLGRMRVTSEISQAEFANQVREMLAELPDDAVTWQTREERLEQEDEANLSYEGIGAYVAYRPTPAPRIILLSIVPDSPAQEAGLEAHDSIVSIDGVPITDDEGLDAVARIRGPAGSDVVLTVRSPDGITQEVTVTRKSLVATGRIRVGVIPGTNIGYMLFPPAPYEEMAQDTLASLQLMQESVAGDDETVQLDGLILDLRISRSGQSWPIEVLPAFFADGELGEFFTRSESQVFTVEGQDFLNSQSIPLAILIGPDTQGGPEIFAAIMQSIGRAAVIGLPTEGLVERASDFRMPDGSRIVVATTSYRTPDGRDIGIAGVQPSVRVEADWDQVTGLEDPVLDTAVDFLSTAATP